MLQRLDRRVARIRHVTLHRALAVTRGAAAVTAVTEDRQHHGAILGAIHGAVHGAIRDFVVDLRVGSPMERRLFEIELNPSVGGLLVPAGCAHAYEALEDDTIVCYAQDIPFDDPAYVAALAGFYEESATRIAALAQPRFHHQWQPDELRIERSATPRVLKELERRGHRLKIVDSLGATQAVGLDQRRKVLIGCADPRTEGIAAGTSAFCHGVGGQSTGCRGTALRSFIAAMKHDTQKLAEWAWSTISRDVAGSRKSTQCHSVPPQEHGAPHARFENPSLHAPFRLHEQPLHVL